MSLAAGRTEFARIYWRFQIVNPSAEWAERWIADSTECTSVDFSERLEQKIYMGREPQKNTVELSQYREGVTEFDTTSAATASGVRISQTPDSRQRCSIEPFIEPSYRKPCLRLEEPASSNEIAISLQQHPYLRIRCPRLSF